MTAIRRVGMLGLGKMGAPMARHLIDKGYGVCGYDPQEAARRAVGAQALDSAAAVAQASELVIMVVGFDHEVETVMYGPQGVMEGARAGLIVAVGSTIASSCRIGRHVTCTQTSAPAARPSACSTSLSRYGARDFHSGG